MKITTLASLQAVDFNTVLLALKETAVAKFDELVDELEQDPARKVGEKIGVMAEFIAKPNQKLRRPAN